MKRAPRKMREMDSVNKRELKAHSLRLGSLLTQKKALNSKVTSRHFELFREAVDGGGDLLDIKSRLSRLEQALKQEGLFKNVKADFVQIKKEILNALYWTEDNSGNAALPGIAPKDRTFYVAPRLADEPAANTSTVLAKFGGVSTDDMRVLNNAIGKLFRHLQINGQKDVETKVSDPQTLRDEAGQKENVNILAVSHQEDSFHDLVLKLKNFEKEFQRQKVQQHREIMRLQEETKRLNKNMNEMKRENERLKGVQPIVTKAKGRQVERIEERYRTEKKGMEEKLNELEEGMKKKLEKAIHDRDEMKHQIKDDMDGLVSSIRSLHWLVVGTGVEEAGDHRHHPQGKEDGVDQLQRDLINSVNAVMSGVQDLKNKNQEFSRKVNDMTNWRKCLKELDREITRFCRPYGNAETSSKREPTTTLQEIDPHDILECCKNKLGKTKENINVKLRSVSDTNSLLRRKEKDVTKVKRDLEELSSDINQLYDSAMAVQAQDISMIMPPFERRLPVKQEDDFADDLPEADRQEQADLVDKLQQTGAMVQHFQKVLADRTNTMNKMENDLLPLKIRVNRLHDDIAKGMRSEGQDSPDDLVKTFREKSPDGPHVFSKEVSNMLTKLSKMELSIRHLLEQHGKKDR